MLSLFPLLLLGHLPPTPALTMWRVGRAPTQCLAGAYC